MSINSSKYQMRKIFALLLTLSATLCVFSCSSMRQIHRLDNASYAIGLYLPGEDDSDSTNVQKQPEVSVRKAKKEEVYLMNAEKDENGELVATDKIDAVTVTARFRNKAEHFGMIDLEFQIIVPGSVIMDDMRVCIQPEMYTLGDTTLLRKFYITGNDFIERRVKGCKLYDRFIGKIVTDSTEFLHRRQFEGFLQRNIPQVYAMKDSQEEFSASEFRSFFDVDAREALNHYLNKGKIHRNNQRIESADEMYAKYCPYEVEEDNLLFDTTWVANQDFIYLYNHSVKTRPKMKKIDVVIKGNAFNYDDNFSIELDDSEPLSFYVSSISVLTQDIQRKMRNGEIDENYAEGLQALKDMDYEAAGKILRKYKDYNAALAMVALDSNYTAEDILVKLPKSAYVNYLLAIVNVRLGREDLAVDFYTDACRENSMFIHRGNLDPEILSLIKKYNLDKVLSSDDFSNE